MRCIANFEIRSEASVTTDDRWLTLSHPTRLFDARMRNITRKNRATPFLLTLQIAFDAPRL